MTDFSISQAFGAGFRLLGRKPFAVIMWGVTYVLIGIAPWMLLAAVIAPSILSPRPDATPDPAVLAATLLISPVQWICGMAAISIILAAVNRAVLDPKDDRFFYMRLGWTELWLALVQIVLGILFALVFLVAFLLAAIVGGAAIMSAGGLERGLPAIGIGGGVVVLALVGFFWWIAMRLSLAVPMTVADRTFRLFESWAMTRGHALKLFVLSLLVLVTIVLLFLLLILAVALIVGLGVGGVAAFTDPGALEEMLTARGAALLIPIGLLVFLIYAVMIGVGTALWSAPWAEAYLELSGRTVDAEAFT